MAFDCFLKIDGIDGESTDDKHSDWIELISFNHGISQAASGSLSSGGARSSERCDFQDLSVVKSLDKASPKIALACCNGTHIASVKIELCRATGDKQKYMEYSLSDVLVTSVRPGGSANTDDPLPMEEVSFSCGKMEWIYTETDHKTGKAKGDVKASWDLTTNSGG